MAELLNAPTESPPSATPEKPKRSYKSSILAALGHAKSAFLSESATAEAIGVPAHELVESIEALINEGQIKRNGSKLSLI